MATRDSTSAPATRELTALPSAVRDPSVPRWPPLACQAGGDDDNDNDAGDAENGRPPGARVRRGGRLPSEGGGRRTLCTHTRFVVAPSVFFFLLLYYARRTRSRPSHTPVASSVKSEKKRRPRVFFKYCYRVRPSAPAPTAHRLM